MKLQNLTHLLIGIICIGLLPRAQAVVPPPDGGYPNLTTAEGTKALQNLTSGAANTAIGWYSLFTDTSGGYNTGVGAGTVVLNNNGEKNAAIGVAALLLNTDGFENTGIGALALLNNAIGIQNTAIGGSALPNNTEGSGNTATGFLALSSNIDGDLNTAYGDQALKFNTSGSNNIALGNSAGNGVITANHVICIGDSGANVGNSCYIGNIYSNVQPIVGTDPDSVTITAGGRLGRGNVSSRRYKHDIEPMEKASKVLYALKPVSFLYNKEYDATKTRAFGLIAEEVAEAYPDLVGRNPKGEPDSVRYEQTNAMLLNEFLKEHREVAELKSTVAEQRKGMEAMAAQRKEQVAQIQKVSAQLEASKPAPQVVNNP